MPSITAKLSAPQPINLLTAPSQMQAPHSASAPQQGVVLQLPSSASNTPGEPPAEDALRAPGCAMRHYRRVAAAGIVVAALGAAYYAWRGTTDRPGAPPQISTQLPQPLGSQTVAKREPASPAAGPTSTSPPAPNVRPEPGATMPPRRAVTGPQATGAEDSSATAENAPS